MYTTLAPALGLALLFGGASGLALELAQDPPGGLETFSGALRAAGWAVDVLNDGSLQLTRAAPVPAVAPSPPVAPASVVEPGSEPAPAPTMTPPGLASGQHPQEVDWTPLLHHGWRLEHDRDHATLLFPPESGVKSGAETVIETPSDLLSLLGARGWRAQRESDGTLLLSPLGHARGNDSPLAPEPGQVPRAVARGQISLPVDSWEKAKEVAASWLESVDDPNLRLGNVRRIHRVYLINVLGSSPPYPLRHQLAIRVDDGRVLVLD